MGGGVVVVAGGGSGVDCGAVDCAGGALGVAPWAFVPAGGGAGSPAPGGMAGTTGCFWPGNSVMWPLFKDFCCWRKSLY